MSVTPKIKICGITTVPDAEFAVSLGAWAIGLIFVRTSPRRVAAAEASRIAAAVKRKTLVTGVFLNHPLDEVVKLHERVGFDVVQLHGDEGPSFATEVQRRTGAKVIKAIRVGDAGDVRALDAFRNVDFHLVDGPGSGETIEPVLLRNRRTKLPMLLAGGLTPENVAEMIGTFAPFGVDVASGVESEPGIKDHAKLEAFFAAVRSTAPAKEEEPAAPELTEQEKLAERVAAVERLPRAEGDVAAAAVEPPAADAEPPAADAEPPAADAEPPAADAEPPAAAVEPPAAAPEPPAAAEAAPPAPAEADPPAPTQTAQAPS